MLNLYMCNCTCIYEDYNNETSKDVYVLADGFSSACSLVLDKLHKLIENIISLRINNIELLASTENCNANNILVK